MNRIPTNRPPTHPGEMLLEEFIRPLHLTRRELARRLDVPESRINDIVRARRPVTPDMALRLERLLGMESGFWMNLQVVWDLYHARRSASAGSIRSIDRLPALRGRGRRGAA